MPLNCIGVLVSFLRRLQVDYTRALVYILLMTLSNACMTVNTSRKANLRTSIRITKVFRFAPGTTPYLRYAADKECRSIRADEQLHATYLRAERRGNNIFYLDFYCEPMVQEDYTSEVEED